MSKYRTGAYSSLLKQFQSGVWAEQIHVLYFLMHDFKKGVGKIAVIAVDFQLFAPFSSHHNTH